MRHLAGFGVSLALVAMVTGCPGPTSSQTEVPDGPSEEYELPEVGTADQGDMTEEEAEQAAKVAAAQKVLKKVKDRDPEEEKKKMIRSRAISAQARKALGKRAHDEAVRLARQALKVHEQNVDAMLVVAEVYYKQGKYELTRAVTSSALQVDAKTRLPEDTSRAYNLQGFAMLAMGEPNVATQSFKKAAEADEKNAAAWNNLGTRYLDAGDVATATACFKYAIELDPRFFKAQLNYGASLRAERKWQEAEQAMRKSLELRPGYAEAYFNLGVLYLDADPFPGLDTTQRLNKAIQNLTKYRDLAIADKGARPGSSTPGLGAEGSVKAPPPRVSKERADDYIRVAKKGLEREGRRIDREKERETKAATAGDGAAEGDPASAEAGAADGATPATQGPTTQGPGAEGGKSPQPATPGQPDPQGPGATPSKPTPQGPGQPEPAKPAPSKPTPQGPGGSAQPAPAKPAPAKPAPSKPAPAKPAPAKPAPAKPAPSKPAPAKPAPAKPAPSKPAPTQPTPSKPTPSKPAPSKPAPAKPAPQGPAKPAPSKPAPAKPAPQGPTQPSPQQPSVQKPQSASASGDLGGKKVLNKPASRGTRFAGSTLNPMEAGASASSCVGLVFTSHFDAPSPPGCGIVRAHDASVARSDAGPLGDLVVARYHAREVKRA